MSDHQTRVLYITGLLALTMVLAACTPTVEPATTQTAPVVEEATTTTEVEVDTTQDDSTDASAVTDEVKEVSQTYTTPGGEETANFIFTMNGTVVEKVELDITSKNETTQKMQTAFAGGVNALIAGKDLAEIEDLDVVSGSSLTPGAFNKAVATLKAEL